MFVFKVGRKESLTVLLQMQRLIQVFALVWTAASSVWMEVVSTNRVQLRDTTTSKQYKEKWTLNIITFLVCAGSLVLEGAEEPGLG